MKSTLTRISSIVIAACLIVQNAPSAITLDMSLLPTGQGWSWGGRPDFTEAQDFQISGGTILHQNTMAHPFNMNIGSGYSYTGPFGLSTVDMSQPLFIEFNLAIIDYVSNPNNYAGTYVSIGNGILDAGLEISQNTIRFGAGTPTVNLTTGWDNSSAHTYRMALDFNSSTYEVFRDGVSLGVGGVGAGATQRIYFGDGTGGANAEANWNSFSVWNVPEPSRTLLFALGLMVVSARRRRMNG